MRLGKDEHGFRSETEQAYATGSTAASFVFFFAVLAGAGSAAEVLLLVDLLGAEADSDPSPVVPSSARFL